MLKYSPTHETPVGLGQEVKKLLSLALNYFSKLFFKSFRIFLWVSLCLFLTAVVLGSYL